MAVGLTPIDRISEGNSFTTTLAADHAHSFRTKVGRSAGVLDGGTIDEIFGGPGADVAVHPALGHTAA